MKIKETVEAVYTLLKPMSIKDTIEAIKGCDGIESLGEYAQDCPDVCIKVADLRELAEAYERLVKEREWFERKLGYKVSFENIVIENNIFDVSDPRPVESQ